MARKPILFFVGCARTLEVVRGVAEELLQLELGACDTFQATGSEPLDPHVAERLSKTLDVPLPWLLRNRCRRFWHNMKMASMEK